jgi:hypothetical protein
MQRQQYTFNRLEEVVRRWGRENTAYFYGFSVRLNVTKRSQSAETFGLLISVEIQCGKCGFGEHFEHSCTEESVSVGDIAWVRAELRNLDTVCETHAKIHRSHI